MKVIISFMLAGIVSVHLLLPQSGVWANEDPLDPLSKGKIEQSGVKKVNYLVKDIESLKRPYNYTIGKTTFLIIEIFGILALVGALLFGFGHGFGRFLATKKTPIELEMHGSEYIYALVQRIGHWMNAMLIVFLLFTGFIMHYMGPTHLMGRIHNFMGNSLVALYFIFIIYELATKDYKQFITQKWEIKEGILKQALFYARDIFLRKEHPYHMTKDSRLNPLQKPAYFGVMFFVVPVIVGTGFLMAHPTNAFSAVLISYFGQENMNIIFIVHLVTAFAVLAFLVGHIYLATTGDTLLQHFEVMITGKHKHYDYKKPGNSNH